ncbi:hypothetical protein ACTJKT_01795 [Pseudomonas sp. 22526]|uniref:hypothetical protein n=1 Tax=Pseudomonas sp. 22526 TaxID=3453937 RepID=UPI003F85D31D
MKIPIEFSQFRIDTIPVSHIQHHCIQQNNLVVPESDNFARFFDNYATNISSCVKHLLVDRRGDASQRQPVRDRYARGF